MVCKAFGAVLKLHDEQSASLARILYALTAEETERMEAALKSDNLRVYSAGYDVSSGDRLEDDETLKMASDMLTVTGNDQQAMMANAQVSCIVCVAPTGSEISLFVSRAFLLRVDHGHPEDTADLNAPAYIMS